MTDKLLTPAEAAGFLGLSRQTLNCWRMSGRHGLPFMKAGRVVRYKLSDLQAFVDGHMHGRRQVSHG